MSRVVVMVSDFELGTRIADAVASLGEEAVFPSDQERMDTSSYEDSLLVIVDLTDELHDVLKLVKHIRKNHPELRLVGVAPRVQKKDLSEARDAGCDWVLPKSSVVRNLPTLLEKGAD